MPDLSASSRSAHQVVAERYPFGVFTGEHTVAAAREAAELVRYLNIATLDRSGEALPDPNTAAAVLGALNTACDWLPQLLAQLLQRMHDFAGDPDLATGSSTDTASALAARAMAHLGLAQDALSPLARELRAAFAAADRLYLDTDDED
ncbi:hypothetical protein ACQEVZ_60705 [Dactylosporangium sp. CA-152071]|uniref:hypothetical protein n=1 Tax=Dactylosporangium sp. CA-152071 TaxID=3239933 RepID=UPI003D943DB2